MNVPLDEVIYFDAITTTPSTGAAVDADSTPTFAVYEESTDTDIGVGGNLTKRTSLTGNYRGTFTLSAANGFEVGKWYSIIGTAVVGGVTGKAVLKNFRVVAAEAIAGKTKVDVDALLGTAWLTPGTAGTPDVNAKLIGATAQTGADVGGIVSSGTYGNSALKTLIDAVDNFVDTEMADAVTRITDVQGRLPAALGANGNITADVRDFGGTAGSFTSGRPDVQEVAGSITGNLLGNVGGNVTGSVASVTSLGATARGQVNAEVDTALDTAIPVSPTADSINERIKTIDDAYTATRAGYLDNINNSYLGTLSAANIRAAVGLGSANLDTQLGAIDDYLDTEVAAILAAVDTEIGAIQTTLAALFTTALTESYRTDGATGTVAQLLYEINQTIGERSFSGTTGTVKKIDGSTTAFTQTINSASTPTSITHA